MAPLMERIKHEDLYAWLGITLEADLKTIKKAYRQKALQCHPDKNPDNPQAAQEFHRLSDAYEVLVDPEAKQAYDQVLKARQAQRVRHQQLDAKRQKLKNDLEAREQKAAAFQQRVDQLSEEDRLARQIERLRREGSRALEEEQERLRRQIHPDTARPAAPPAVPSSRASAKLKVRWKGETAYDRDTLRQIFTKYGDVGEVVVLPSAGKMSGLVEMKSASAAQLAAQIETGFAHCPLKVKLIGGSTAQPAPACPAAELASAESITRTSDFESLVMRKLRQEEERKRLIREIEAQDGGDHP